MRGEKNKSTAGRKIVSERNVKKKYKRILANTIGFVAFRYSLCNRINGIRYRDGTNSELTRF